MICCQQLAGASQPSASPFEEAIVTGYYDGPTEGFARCAICRRTHAFQELAIRTGDEFDLHVYALAPLEQDLASIGAMISRELPQWNASLVVPPLGAALDHEIDRLLAAPCSMVILAARLDGKILDARARETSDAVEDWFAWFDTVGARWETSGRRQA